MTEPKKRILVTAGLPYSNGDLHVGHMGGAHLPADIYVRFKRMQGYDARSVCGSDDYGVAIVLSAAKQGKTPAELAAYYNERQKRALEQLGIKFDVYGATSQNKYHTEVSQEFFLRVHEKGFFEKQESEQFFDVQKNMFLPDRFVKGTCANCNTPDQNGDQCEQCGAMLDVTTLRDATSVVSGARAEVRKTVHWFLDLSRCEQQVRDWLGKAQLRDHTRAYVETILSAGLVKRSMTRDISWGIPVPLNDPDAVGKVLYVWFDAPIGYISNTKQLCAERDGSPEKVSEWWSDPAVPIYHFIGEDNTIFHTVIWTAILSAVEKYSLPRGVIVNNFFNIKFPGKEAEKISKSRGAAPWLLEYSDEGGNPDSLRYYLTAIAPEKARSVYNPEDLVTRNNSELADTFGNFVNRIIQFTLKNHGATIPEPDPAQRDETDLIFAKEREHAAAQMATLLDTFQFRAAQERLLEFARACNKYCDTRAPWKLKKSQPEALGTVLFEALCAIKFLAVAMMPFMPFAGVKLCRALGLEGETVQWEDASVPLTAGSPLETPGILFEKILSDEEVAKRAKVSEKTAPSA